MHPLIVFEQDISALPQMDILYTATTFMILNAMDCARSPLVGRLKEMIESQQRMLQWRLSHQT